MTAWAENKQDTTLATADAWGDEWTQEAAAEVADLVEEGWSDTEIATLVGRTLYAIWSVKHRIAMGDTFDAPRVASSRLIQPGQAGVVYGRVYTFIGDDVPADW